MTSGPWPPTKFPPGLGRSHHQRMAIRHRKRTAASERIESPNDGSLRISLKEPDKYQTNCTTLWRLVQRGVCVGGGVTVDSNLSLRQVRCLQKEAEPVIVRMPSTTRSQEARGKPNLTPALRSWLSFLFTAQETVVGYSREQSGHFRFFQGPRPMKEDVNNECEVHCLM